MFIFNSPAEIREATQVYKISTSVSTENRDQHADVCKKQAGLFRATLETRSATTFDNDKFRFLPNRSPRPFADTKVYFQSASFTTRSVSAFDKINVRENQESCQRNFFAVADTKNRTFEVTWAETTTRTVKSNTQAGKQSRCFRLTSSEVFNALSSSGENRNNRTIFALRAKRFVVFIISFGFFQEAVND